MGVRLPALGAAVGLAAWACAAVTVSCFSTDGLSSGAAVDAADGGRAGLADASGASDTSDAAEATSADLLVWYPFDDASGATAKDLSGNGHDAQLVGAASFTPNGRRGGALLLGDTTSFARAPRSALLDVREELTVAFFVDLTVVPATIPHLISYGSAWEVKLSSATSRRPDFTTSAFAAGLDLGLPAGIEDGGPPANWHHVAFTFTKGSVVGYVDGVVQTMKDMTFPPGTILDLDVLAQLVVGAQSEGTGGFIGAIDDFRLYGRALDANAISELAK